MPRRPNYRQERMERNRKKAARRAEKLAAKTDKAARNRVEKEGSDSAPELAPASGDAES